MPVLKKPSQTPTQLSRPGLPPRKPMDDRVPGIPTENGGNGKDDFAKRYNNTEAGKGQYVPPPPGKYNALITEAQFVKEEGSPQEAVFFECTIADDDKDVYGKTCRIYFNFVDAEGNEVTGMPYFRSAMTMLGYSDPIESEEHLQEMLAQIAQEQMWIVIDVKKKGKWTNIYLSAVPENQDSKPSIEG